MNHMGDWFCDFCDYENTNYSSWKTHLELNHNISYFAKIFNITFMQGTKIQHTASTFGPSLSHQYAKSNLMQASVGSWQSLGAELRNCFSIQEMSLISSKK